jgi:hypothetical protein
MHLEYYNGFSRALRAITDQFPSRDNVDFVLKPDIVYPCPLFNSELTGTIQSKMRKEQTIQFSSNYNHYYFLKN